MSNAGPKTELLLFPTAFELKRIRRHLQLPEQVAVAICGFGPIAAAAATLLHVKTHEPRRVILAGIAGSLDDSIPVATSCTFDSVTVEGIGAYDGATLISPAAMGFAQFDPSGNKSIDAIGDELPLSPCPFGASAGKLLTVCAASGSRQMALDRQQRFPGTRAEDMEGFAVAVACRLANCPLTLVRGISNLAGVRDKSQWQIEAALKSVAGTLNQLFESAAP